MCILFMYVYIYIYVVIKIFHLQEMLHSCNNVKGYQPSCIWNLTVLSVRPCNFVVQLLLLIFAILNFKGLCRKGRHKYYQ